MINPTSSGGGITGPITGLLSVGASIFSNERTNSANRKMADLAYSRNLEQWNRENEYNTPDNQKKRLIEAGINPHTVYGAGNGTGGTAAKSPEYQAPKQDFRTDTSGLMQGLELMLKQTAMYQNIELQKANADNLRARTENERQRKELIIRDILGKDISNNQSLLNLDVDNQTRLKSAMNQLSLQQEEIRNKRLSGNLTEEDIAGRKISNNQAQLLYDIDKEFKRQGVNLDNKTKAFILNKMLPSQVAHNLASADQAKSQSSLNRYNENYILPQEELGRNYDNFSKQEDLDRSEAGLKDNYGWLNPLFTWLNSAGKDAAKGSRKQHPANKAMQKIQNRNNNKK